MHERDTIMRVNKAVLYKAANGKWNFRLEAGNGKVVAQSNQGYNRKAEAERVIAKFFSNFEIWEEV